MTVEKQASVFFLYMGIFKVNLMIAYSVGFLAVLVSIAFGKVVLTPVSIWGIFVLFLIDRYLTYLIQYNGVKVAEFIKIYTSGKLL